MCDGVGATKSGLRGEGRDVTISAKRNAWTRLSEGRIGHLQPRSWHRLTLIAVAALGVGFSAILALHFSKMQIETTRTHLMVEATAFADDLEQYLQSREMIAKTVGAVFDAPALSAPHPLRSIAKRSEEHTS